MGKAPTAGPAPQPACTHTSEGTHRARAPTGFKAGGGGSRWQARPQLCGAGPHLETCSPASPQLEPPDSPSDARPQLPSESSEHAGSKHQVTLGSRRRGCQPGPQRIVPACTSGDWLYSSPCLTSLSTLSGNPVVSSRTLSRLIFHSFECQPCHLDKAL